MTINGFSVWSALGTITIVALSAVVIYQSFLVVWPRIKPLIRLFYRVQAGEEKWFPLAAVIATAVAMIVAYAAVGGY